MDMVWDVLWQLIKAFFVGGAICAVCQIFIDKTKVTPARILVSLVVLGVAAGLRLSAGGRRAGSRG